MNAVATQQVNIQTYNSQVKLVSDKIVEIVTLYEHISELSHLYENIGLFEDLNSEISTLKSLGRLLPDIVDLLENSDAVVQVEKKLTEVVTLANSMSTVTGLFNNLGLIKNIDSALADLQNLGNYITEVTAEVVYVSSIENPTINISENKWFFKLPRGDTGLTAIPSFDFNELTGDLVYNLNYTHYNPDLHEVLNIPITSLEDATHKAASAFLYDMSVQEVRDTVTNYLNVYLEGIVGEDVNNYLTSTVTPKIETFTNQYLTINLTGRVNNSVTTFLNDNIALIKSTTPGPQGVVGVSGIDGVSAYTPITSFSIEDDVLSQTTTYSQVYGQPSNQNSEVANIRTLVTTASENYISDHSSMFKGETGIGVSAISRNAEGLVTFSLDNGYSKSFNVKDGVDGIDGLAGADGKAGLTPFVDFSVTSTGKLKSTTTYIQTNDALSDRNEELINLKSLVDDYLIANVKTIVEDYIADNAETFKSTAKGDKGDTPIVENVAIGNSGVLTLTIDGVDKTDSNSVDLRPISPISIDRVVRTGYSVEYTEITIFLTNGTSSILYIANGSDGSDGVGILSLGTSKDGVDNVIKLNMTDGTNNSFIVKDGIDGSNGLNNSLTIFNDAGVLKYNSTYTSETPTNVIGGSLVDVTSVLDTKVDEYFKANAGNFQGVSAKQIEQFYTLSVEEAMSQLGEAYNSTKVYFKVVFDDNSVKYLNMNSLTFDDLSSEQKLELKGEAGLNGVDCNLTNAEAVPIISRFEVVSHTDDFPDKIAENLGRVVAFQGELWYLDKFIDSGGVETFEWANATTDIDDNGVLGEL